MTKLQANICIFAATFFWSVEVLFYKIIPDGVSAFAVTCIANLITAVVLGATFFKKVKQNISKALLLDILLLSALSLTFNLINFRIMRTIPTLTVAFLLTLPTVLVPLVNLIMRRKSSAKILFCVAGIFIGILVGLNSAFTLKNLLYLLFFIALMAVRAVVIVKQNDAAKKYEPLQVQVLISMIMAVVSFVLWFAKQPLTFLALEYTGDLWAGIFACGLFATALPCTLNIVANRYTTAQNASIIYSFSVLITVTMAATLPAILGEKEALTPHILLGCLIVVTCAIITEIKLKHKVNGSQSIRREK